MLDRLAYLTGLTSIALFLGAIYTPDTDRIPVLMVAGCVTAILYITALTVIVTDSRRSHS